MKKLLYLLSILCYFSLNPDVYAQTVAQELKEINNAYAKASHISLTIDYKVFDNYNSTLPVEELAGKYVKKDKAYYWKTENQTVIQNDAYFITIDHESKNILVGSPQKSSLPFLSLPLDSVLHFCSHTNMVKLSNGDKKITLVFGKILDNVSKIEIIKNNRDFISKIVLYFEGFIEDEKKPAISQTPRMEITFIQNKDQPVNPALFSEKAYFHENGNKLVNSKEYSDFFIIDQRLNR